MTNAWNDKKHLGNLRLTLEQENRAKNPVISQYVESNRPSPFLCTQKKPEAPTQTARIFVKKNLPKPPKHNISRKCHIKTCKPNLKHDRNKYKWVAPNLQQPQRQATTFHQKIEPKEKRGEEIVKELLNFDDLLESASIRDPFTELGGCFNADDGVDCRSSDRSSGENIFAVSKHDIAMSNLQIKEREILKKKEFERQKTKKKRRGTVIDCIINDHPDYRHETELLESENHSKETERQNICLITDFKAEELWDVDEHPEPQLSIEHEDWDEELERERIMKNEINSIVPKPEINKCSRNLTDDNLTAQTDRSKTIESESNRKDSSPDSYRGDSFDDSYSDDSYSHDEESWDDDSRSFSDESVSEPISPNSDSYAASLSSGTEDNKSSDFNNRRRRKLSVDSTASDVSRIESEIESVKDSLPSRRSTKPCKSIAEKSNLRKEPLSKQVEAAARVKSRVQKTFIPYERAPRFEKRQYKTTTLYNWKTNKVETIQYGKSNQKTMYQDTVRNACANKPGLLPLPPVNTDQSTVQSVLSKISPTKNKKKKKKNKKDDKEAAFVQPVDFPPLMKEMKAIAQCTPSSPIKNYSLIAEKKHSVIPASKPKTTLQTVMAVETLSKTVIPKPKVSQSVVKKTSRIVLGKKISNDPYNITMEEVLSRNQTTDDMEKEVQRVNEEIRENVIQLAPIIEEESSELQLLTDVEANTSIMEDIRQTVIHNPPTQVNTKGMTRMERIKQALADPFPKSTIKNDENTDADLNTKEKIALWESRNNVDENKKKSTNDLKKCEAYYNLLTSSPKMQSTINESIAADDNTSYDEPEIAIARYEQDGVDTESEILSMIHESFQEDSFFLHQHNMAKLRKKQNLKQVKYEVDVSKDIMMMQTLTIQGDPKEVSERVDQSYGVFKSHWSPYEEDKLFWNDCKYQSDLDQEILILNRKPLPKSLLYKKICNKDCFFDVGKKLHLHSPEATRTTACFI